MTEIMPVATPEASQPMDSRSRIKGLNAEFGQMIGDGAAHYSAADYYCVRRCGH